MVQSSTSLLHDCTFLAMAACCVVEKQPRDLGSRSVGGWVGSLKSSTKVGSIVDGEEERSQKGQHLTEEIKLQRKISNNHIYFQIPH